MINLILVLVSFVTAALISLVLAAVLVTLAGAKDATWLVMLLWVGLYLPIYRWMRGG
jgi:hypothetical protein